MLKERQKEQARQLILQTAVDLFRQKGYDNVPVEEITEAVGVAKGTFYTFYKSKRDVLMQWSAGRFAALGAAGAPDNHKSAYGNLYTLMEGVLCSVEEEPVLFSAFLKELRQLDNPVEGFDFAQLVIGVLKNSSDAARIGKDIELKAQIISNTLFSFMLDRARPCKAEGMGGDIKKVLRICLEGIFDKEEFVYEEI